MRQMFTIPVAILVIAWGSASAAAQPIPVGRFTAIELRDGGHVTLRPGATQRVSLLNGDLGRSRIEVTESGRLVIDSCRNHCGKGYRLDIEIVTPSVDSIVIRDGGILQVGEGFSGPEQLSASVSNGGIIDARSLAAASVNAFVEEGGAVYVRPGSRLDARVDHGGVITYWGDAIVRSAVQDGGAIVRGKTGDRNKPLAQLGPQAPLAPPPVPPVPALGGR